MVVIRCARRGRRHRPFYELVVADARSPRDGKFIERVGFHNPFAGESEEKINIKLDRIDYWCSIGAQPSERVASLLKQYKNAQQTAASQ